MNPIGANIASIIASLANIAICCLFVMTMYQITTSIRLMLGLIDEVVAKRRKKVLYSSVIGFFVICSTPIMVMLIRNDGRLNLFDNTMWIAFIVIYTILSIFYSVTLIRLWTAMKHLI